MLYFLKSACLIVLLLTVLPCLAASSTYDRVLRVRDGKVISFTDMIEEVRKVSFVFVGEDHTNERHHSAQLDVIKALRERGVPSGIGLEMFRADNQRELDMWVGGKSELRRFIELYYENWRLPWDLYRDIFFYARENRISLIGLNVSEGISRKVSETGFQSLNREELSKLPPGISCSVDESYMEFIRKAHEVHGRTGKSFVYFCEAQMVWDKTMAWRLLEYKKKNPGRTVVVLSGTGHSWKPGIPAQIRMEEPKSTIAVILPGLPGRRDSITVKYADYILPD